MEYSKAKDYLKQLKTYGSNYGLERMRELLNRLDNPQRELSFIHVAGTNGKGSVIAYLSQILTDAGYRTGRYTSPAVFSDTECFVANQIEITELQIGILLGRIKKAADGMVAEGYDQPTVFEIETAMAFLFFQHEKCEFAIVETGLGGALDATNVIPAPICTVFTLIGYDHMGILGNTLTEIAKQKAGVIKSGTTVVSTSQKKKVEEVLRKVCNEKGVPLIFTEKAEMVQSFQKQDADQTGDVQLFRYKEHGTLQISLLGQHQVENALEALEVVRVLREKGFTIETKDVIQGLRKTKWRGRFTCICKNPVIYVDGAHNEAAALELKNIMQSHFQSKKWIFIMGVFADKEYEKIVRLTAEHAERIFAITPDHARALPAKILAEAISKYNKNVEVADNLEQALQKGMEHIGEDGMLLAFGSFSFLKSFTEIVENNMFRVDKIIKNDRFLKSIKQIELLESERTFCKHGLNHLLDVARIAYIINLERNLEYPKEMIYATALLHDIGRVKQYEEGVPHKKISSILAKEILPECGFIEKEIQMITDAIDRHSTKEDTWEHSLAAVLFEADKKSRHCFACSSKEQCNWDAARKTQVVVY